MWGVRRTAAIVVALVTASSCAPEPQGASDALGDDAITVASFDFTESEILAELYAQALERRGYRVERQLGLGPRELVEPALQNGLVELVPEYAGSLLEFLTRSPPSSAALAEVRAALDRALGDRGLALLESALAQDRNGFAVTGALARDAGLRTLSDLEGRSDLVVGGPPECEERPLCLPGLEDTYGVRAEEFVALDLSGPLTADALDRGVVDVALMFTTSPELERHDLVLLRDDRDLQPAEHVTPILHARTLERFGPSLAGEIDAVSALLTTQDLRGLNADVVLDGVTPAAAARAWLDEHGFVPDPE